MVTGRHIDLATDHRAQPLLQGGPVKLERPEQVSVVGDGHRGHVHGSDLSGQGWDTDRCIEERVMGVQMEMHKRAAQAHDDMIPEPPLGVSEGQHTMCHVDLAKT